LVSKNIVRLNQVDKNQIMNLAQKKKSGLKEKPDSIV